MPVELYINPPHWCAAAPCLRNGFNLNISRYVSTVAEEEVVDLSEVAKNLSNIEESVASAKKRHNQFLRELGLPELK